MSTIIYPAPIFGPIQSRRLGRSLGINLSPPDGKLCNFDCVYCECGENFERRPKSSMSSVAFVTESLEKTLVAMRERGDRLDALTFSGNGEPTSHPQFESIVENVLRLRDLYCPNATVCVLTNATRIMKPDIKRALLKVDRPCLKLDTVDFDYIQTVDRPTSHYDLDGILESMREFSGRCIIQSMFLKGTVKGKDVNNLKEKFVLPWVDAVCGIKPLSVDIYTVSRETPIRTLIAATKEELEAVADLLRRRQIDVKTYV